MTNLNFLSISRFAINRLATILFIAFLTLATGCPQKKDPDNFVIIPPNDNTPPTTGITINDGNIHKDFNETSTSTTIKVGRNVTIIAGATDDDGGIKAVELWAVYTLYKPGQVTGPDLAGAPIKEYLGSETIGVSVRKNQFFTYTLDMLNERGSYSSVKVDLWAVGKNYHSGKTQTPTISLIYP